ncbi:MAG: biopolymer transporter ExbD [Alistipes sp.]|jgi:biopolymer transport protein ExbD|nr:biopolymer transporter ExbD [Alistipes sp.]MBO7265165.1 biopolymer transporter ExbD [Alistipes sp.]
MAIKRSSKIDSTFSSSSMTDLVFLLLVFFVLATTLINPNNAVKLTLPSSSSTMGDPSSVSISVLSGPAGYSYIFNGNKSNPYIDANEMAVELNAYYENHMAESQKALIVSVHCEKDQTTVDALLAIIDMINDQNKAAGEIAPGVQRYKMVLATDKK